MLNQLLRQAILAHLPYLKDVQIAPDSYITDMYSINWSSKEISGKLPISSEILTSINVDNFLPWNHEIVKQVHQQYLSLKCEKDNIPTYEEATLEQKIKYYPHLQISKEHMQQLQEQILNVIAKFTVADQLIPGPWDMTKSVPGLRKLVSCPKCITNPITQLNSMIQHLNDRHKMPREDIADWLESLDIDLEFKEIA